MLLGTVVMVGWGGGGGRKIPLPSWFDEGQHQREISFQQWQREKMLHVSELWSILAKRSGNFQEHQGMRGWHGAQPSDTGRFLCCRHLGNRASNLGACKFYMVPWKISLPLAHSPKGLLSRAGAAALWHPFGLLRIRDE